jgi:Squalene-hopene cyclase C-terminal domain
MRHAVGNLLKQLLQGSKLDPQSVLWGILIGAAVLSALHLVTMLATRWGDRRVTGKALLFSLMLHFGCLVGVITVIPPQPLPPGDPEGSDSTHRVVIHSVSADQGRETGVEPGGTGQTPVWDRIPTPKNLASIGPQAALPAATAAPNVDRVAQPLKPDELPAPDVAAMPDVKQAPTATPVQQDSTNPKQAANTPQIDAPKSAPLAAQSPDAPRPAERSTAPTATANIDRQATTPTEIPPVATSDTGHLDPPALPDPPAPKASIASTSPTNPALANAAPAPVPSLPSDPETASTSGPSATATSSAGVTSSMPGPSTITPQLPGNLSGVAVNRLPTGAVSGSPSGQPETARVEDYQAVDDRPMPVPQAAGSGSQPLIVRRSAGVPPTYRLRKLSNRKGNARQFGGTEYSERSVEASLRWLAHVQSPNGHWDAKAFGAGRVKIDENGVDRDYAGRDADSGVTALAVLAFLGAGYTHEEGQYADTVDRALRWLIAQQKPDGNLGADAGHFAMNYCHGIATYAIAEAYGMQNDPTSNTMLREPLLRGVRYILQNQNPDGGWRYLKGQKSDISMTGWQLMALKSAEIAGVNIPKSAKAEVVAFLKARSLGTYGGLAGYREDLPPSASMTAEAMFCKQMLGMRRDNAASREAAEYLLARLPVRTSFNEYYWYYGTLAMYQFGGEGWSSWNGAIRDLLISEQRTDGDYAGSWDPIGPWAQYGGRIYSTALSTLCLEVYYRFLPLYQIGRAPTDERAPKE